MFDDTFFAELFHHPVTFQRHWAILDVELLQAPAVVGDALDTGVADHLAALHAQLLQVGAVFGHQFEPDVRDVALADIQGPDPRA